MKTYANYGCAIQPETTAYNDYYTYAPDVTAHTVSRWTVP